MNKSRKATLTKEGIGKLQERMKYLEMRRDRLWERIREIRSDTKSILVEEEDLGELTARRSRLEEQLVELEEILKKAAVVKSRKRSQVGVGSQVKLDNSKFSLSLQLVDSIEADPRAGLISADSPLGAAVYGKKLGDEVVVQMPDKKTVYKVVEIA